MNYIIGIDQSTQGTKALLFDGKGQIVHRTYLPHEQKVNEYGWVSHDPLEIYANVIKTTELILNETQIGHNLVKSIGISNQRETSVVWNKSTGLPLADAIVWQCNRAKTIVERLSESERDLVKQKTGLIASPYYPAAKYAWFNDQLSLEENSCLGTIDSWLVFKLTKGKVFATDFSNASRTQLFNIHDLSWDETLCELFGIKKNHLAKVMDSDSNFGMTDFDGLFDNPVPILCVMGDSHAALFAQNGIEKGTTKVTYGTGSSIVMNTGNKLYSSDKGLSTSIAWKLNNQVSYILEGNVNNTGSVITWLKDDLELIKNISEIEELIKCSNPDDETVLVPAFSGLGAPYWKESATAMFSGMTRTTGKAELVRAAVNSIAYQINDILEILKKEAKTNIEMIKVDGGPTKNEYLMQLQSDISNLEIFVSLQQEASCMGAAFIAGISSDMYSLDILKQSKYMSYSPNMPRDKHADLLDTWNKSVLKTLS